MRTPNPLQWPAGWSRTTEREKSRFTIGMTVAVDDLLLELDRLNARNVVITSDLPTRGDGRPYASGRAEDPGIAVWFEHEGEERVFACDRWLTPAENVRAISSTIAALRGMSRWGASEMTARAFQGFKALPAGPPPDDAGPSWRDVLGVPAGNLQDAETAYRRLSRAMHPDVTGNPDDQVALNRAIEKARAAFGAL